jgi:heat shock protein beta
MVMKRRNITDWKWDYERVNDVQPIWIRNKKEIKKEEYDAFYKSLTKDNDAPFSYEHGSLEGEVNFKYIIYIPDKRPHDLYDNYYQKNSAMRLYVRRVMVSENFEEIVPKYLNFIKGVVDSDDLPLNVSREQLQQHKMIKVMSKKLVRNVINIIVKLAAKEDLEDEEEEKKAEEENKENVEKSNKEKGKYIKFFENYGKNIKLGVIEDSPNRGKLTTLLRYY